MSVARLVAAVLCALLLAASGPATASYAGCASLFEDVGGSPCDQSGACAAGGEGSASCRQLVKIFCSSGAGLDRGANRGCSNLGDTPITVAPTRSPTNTVAPTQSPTAERGGVQQLNSAAAVAGTAAHVAWAAAAAGLLAAVVGR